MLVDRAVVFLLRLRRAWRLYRRCRYTWRLSWAKAGSQCGCFHMPGR